MKRGGGIVSQTLIYVTTGNRKEAKTLAHELIRTRLAACANILEKTTSIFFWEGKICENEEVSIILKTREDLVEELIKKIKNFHSFDCPCIIALPICGGNTDFLNWINDETITK
jgi:periplasmic divalent cation tolerance protein